jgi:hypothetical protein
LPKYVSDLMTFPIAFWALKEKEHCALRAGTESPMSQENRNMRWGNNLPLRMRPSNGRPV